ncbi:MAG: group 1 glycosyl transferase [Rhodospirillales bacterium]|jgi:glycosyltransferase involved in cell wall biosynthesis|nr:group 1 glycosyl transferase [Rhodospirillales bacterium]
MIVGIDANPAIKAQRTGTETYASEIIKAMAPLDRSVLYRLYAKQEPPPELRDLGPNVAWRVMPFKCGWTLARLSLEMMVDPPDVLFVPAHTLPILTPKKSVIMIHDLAFDHFPEVYGWRRRILHRYDVRLARRKAGHILTPSEFTRHDLADRYRVPLTRITCVHHGIGRSGVPWIMSTKPPFLQPYFFYIGRIESKKNIERLLQAFGTFKNATHLPHRLLLGGKPGLGYARIRTACESLGSIRSDVEFLDYLSDDDAHRHMAHAEALVYPSLFEGFGMPILDAFALGTPVIASNATSLPEVAGDAAILVDPLDVKALAQAMCDIATDRHLRDALCDRGKTQCRSFSWQRAGQETLAVLRYVWNGSAGAENPR